MHTRYKQFRGYWVGTSGVTYNARRFFDISCVSLRTPRLDRSIWAARSSCCGRMITCGNALWVQVFKHPRLPPLGGSAMPPTQSNRQGATADSHSPSREPSPNGRPCLHECRGEGDSSVGRGHPCGRNGLGKVHLWCCCTAALPLYVDPATPSDLKMNARAPSFLRWPASFTVDGCLQ